jgi:hypothetical protein
MPKNTALEAKLQEFEDNMLNKAERKWKQTKWYGRINFDDGGFIIIIFLFFMLCLIIMAPFFDLDSQQGYHILTAVFLWITTVVLSFFVIRHKLNFLLYPKYQQIRDDIKLKVKKQRGAAQKKVNLLDLAAAKITAILEDGHEEMNVPDAKDGEVSDEVASAFREEFLAFLIRNLHMEDEKLIFPHFGLLITIEETPVHWLCEIAAKANMPARRFPQFVKMTVYPDGVVKCENIKNDNAKPFYL